jgi:hypothetical protein
MGLPRHYPMHQFPFATSPEEEAYHQRVHYFASALLVFNAGDDVLHALGVVWRQVMERSGNAGSSNHEP